jgi:hypothetical protein
MAKLFISYSSRDKDIALKLAEDLRTLNHEVWLDQWTLKVGHCIPTEISNGLHRTRYLVLLLSKHAVRSKWVGVEWKAAFWDEVKSQSIMVLPVLLEKVAVPKLIQSRKYANFATSYEFGFGELIEAIEFHGQVDRKENSPLLVRANDVKTQVGLPNRSIFSRKEELEFGYIRKELGAKIRPSVESIYYGLGEEFASPLKVTNVRVPLLFVLQRCYSENSEYYESWHALDVQLALGEPPDSREISLRLSRDSWGDIDLMPLLLKFGLAGQPRSRSDYSYKYTTRMQRFVFWLEFNEAPTNEIEYDIEELPPPIVPRVKRTALNAVRTR